jgi:hypothetical protein
MPLVRHENAAVVPDEQIQTELGFSDVYLVEGRSILQDRATQRRCGGGNGKRIDKLFERYGDEIEKMPSSRPEQYARIGRQGAGPRAETIASTKRSAQTAALPTSQTSEFDITAKRIGEFNLSRCLALHSEQSWASHNRGDTLRT